MSPLSRRLLALFAVLAALVAVAAHPPSTQAAVGSHYAVIAYSESTGRFGYVNGADCLPDAENQAIANCGACDAKVVVTVQGGWVALAQGTNGTYGCAWSGSSLLDAEVAAVRFCGPYSASPHVVLWAYSF